MPGPYTPKSVTLAVSTTAGGGSSTPLLDMISYNLEDGNTGDVTTWTFGRATPHRRAGDPDQSYSLDGLLNWSDPGQTLLRTARDSGTTIYLTETYPDGAEVVYEAKVTEAPHSATADGDWVENAFSLAIIDVTRTAPST